MVFIILTNGAGAGQATLDDPIFPSLEECEAAREVKVDGLKRVLEARHGTAEIKSICEKKIGVRA